MADNPKEYYRDDFFEFTDSTILLKADTQAVRVNDMDIPYSTAMIDGHRSLEQQHGYFEIRSRKPTSPGFWPAFWLVSRFSWPPEIDVYEYYTSRPQRWTNSIHYMPEPDNRKMEFKAYKVRYPSDGFHIYAVEWNEKEIKWYFNNELVRTSSTGIETFKFPMHIIINIAMEDPSRASTKMNEAVFPNFLEVDYVRAYKRKE